MGSELATGESAAATGTPLDSVHPDATVPPVGVGGFGRRIGWRDVLWAGLIALIAIAVAFTFRSALVPTDPSQYVEGAVKFPKNVWRPEGLSRWGFVLPMLPFARLWGDSTATYYAIPLLSTGALAGILYLLGTRYVSRTAGAVGALLALATPLVFVNLTRGYTDLPATMLIGAGILLATLAGDAAARSTALTGRWGWSVPVLLMACGFVTGWGFEVRETVVFAWPVIGWILWQVGRPLRTLLWFVPPALAWWLLDMGLSARIYGDPLLKLHTLTGADISTSPILSDGAYVGHSRWWYATIMFRSIWNLSGGPAVMIALVVGIIGGAVFWRQLGRIWAWGMLSLALLWAQGGPLSPAHPSVRLDVARYWLAFIVPLMLVAAGTLVILVRRAHGGWRVATWVGSVALVLSVLVPSVRFATTYAGFAPNGGLALAELRDYLEESGGIPDNQIWADWGTQRVLTAYQNGPFGDQRWETKDFRSMSHLLKDLSEPRENYPQTGDYVVIYSQDSRTCWHCQRALRPLQKAFGTFPMPGWEKVFTSSTGNLVLYRIGPETQWPYLPDLEGTDGSGQGDGAEEPDGGVDEEGAVDDPDDAEAAPAFLHDTADGMSSGVPA